MAQKKSVQNEFQFALESLNGCIASINCGCTITPDECLFADSLYYRCKEFMRIYKDFV